MKKLLSIVLSILMVVTMLPMSVLPASAAEASDSVSYVDYTWNEESKTLSSETKSVDTYTEITSTTTEMTSGWYVVNGEVTVAERMTATGEVHLILADGAHLTASLGITVNEGNSLYIYGQSSDESTMGKLTATATDFDAAIGSLDAYHAGTIVINGGNINASTSKQGAGIGSGATRGGYQITINAGVVTATSGSSPAAIGSGNNRGSGVRGTVHSICINGGVVNATSSGAAIGGGSLFDGGDITITGGTVTAKSVNQGAAIGGGYGGSGGNITITGGTVTATSVKQGAAIGGGYRGSGGNITITGGNVNATYTNSGYYGVAIGAGYYGDSAGNILITGGTVTATSTRGCGIGVYNGDNGRIVILGGTVNASGSGTVHINAGDSGSMMLVDGTTVTISGDFTLQTDFVLPEGYTLEISEGATLTIPEGVTLTLPEEYTLVSNGTVNAVGTVNCITHKYVEGVCICGLECSHVGGTPTCMAPAVCTTCGTGYGEVDPTNHNWENGVCTYGCNTNHEPHDWSGKDGICTVCGATCTHTGGTATCKTQAVCEVCEVSYGELDPDNHEYENNNGFCTECDAYEPATLVTNENYESFYLKADYVGYYAISNGGQLFWYANYINTVDRTANAVLTADIDLENRPWTPIGSTGENNNNFRGVFDGQNYIIKGLYVEGGRAGLGFFGEVRTGTVKNFTIFGNVVVNTEVDYIGGVIGSICGVNGETDLERNGAIIQNITSFVNVTAKAHGIGMIGGFVGYANHQSLIEKCAWYGTFDAGEYRVDSGAGGFIGKIQENTSEVTIRDCGAYGTIKTNYAKNSYNNTPTIYMGGFLSFSNTGAKTTIENCLFAGRFERGENLTDEARLGAFGTLRSVNAIKNCYYLGDDGLEAVHSDSNLKPGSSDNVEITKVTGEELKSGKIAYKLQEANEIWGQSIGTDAYPSFTGGTVYQVENCKGELGYSNTNENIGHQWVNGTCTVCDLVCGHSGGTATCTEQAKCEHCGTSYGELDPDNHDFGSGNTCICGAEIAFTGIVVDDENSDEYRYDETRKTYTIIIPADEVGGIGYLSYDIIGTNLTLIEDTNTLLKVQYENEDGLTSALDDLLVDVLQDNGYFGWSVLGYGDGEWEKLLYSNDGGMTWTTYTFEVKQAYSITVNASQNGTVTANEYAIEGDNIALNVSPAEGYMLDTLSVTDASGNSVDVENNAFTMPASAVTVTATFAVCDHKDGRHETATDNGDGTHDATYSCCGATVTEGHSGGTATCAEQAECQHCGASYGEVNAHDWSNLDGVCANGCGEVCPHEKYTNGVCDKCGYACPHDSYTNGFCTECDAYEPAVDSDSDGYYEIGNAGQLYWFADKAENDRTNYGSANAILTQNIVVNENVLTADGKLNGFGSDFRAWIPPYAYKGTFDGAGKTVSGLYFKDTEESDVGFIGYLYGGTVKNLTVKDSYFNAYSAVGGIVGSVIEGTVTDCFSSATVIAGSLGYAGGIAGENGAGLVERCANSGFVTSGYEAGGIVGYNHNYYDDPDPAIIRHCYNIGSVSGYTVGGIVGFAVQQVGSSVEIDSCWAACELNGTNSVGGLIGHASGSTIRCCRYDKTVFTGNPVGKKTSCNILDSGFKSTEEFASGAAAYLLNGKSSGGFWRQTIGTDAYPGFSGDKVYYGYTSCADNAVIGYTNDPNASAEKPGHSTTAANDKAANCGSKAYCSVCESYYGEVDKTNHDETAEYVNGFCPNCDAYEPAELVDGVYEISNAGQLYWFAAQVDAGKKAISGKLMDNITVNDGTMTAETTDARAWNPIGNNSNQYTGNFNGNGNTISGLYFNDSSVKYVGLFSWVGKGGTVQNVGVINSYISGNNRIGGVAGQNEGTIKGCYNTGIVSIVSDGSGSDDSLYGYYTGGVVGHNLYGTVEDCYNTGRINTGFYTTGGVVGYNEYGTVAHCYNTGTVSGISYTGGVVGYNKDGTVDNCYNTGTVTGSDWGVGGVVSSNDGGITNCYNTGTVSGSKYYVGGVAGHNKDGTVDNCYNTGTVSGIGYVGGVAGYNRGTVTGCYFDSTVYTGNAIGGGSGTATDVEGKSTAQFASGEVAYLLSQGENGSIWGQDLDNGKPVQTTPTFNGAKVYYGYTSCGDTVAKYTNDETISAEKPDHTQKPTYTDNGDGTHSAVYPCCGTTVTEEHTLTYTAKDNVITAACSANCGYSGTATIGAEGKTYDGNAVEVVVSKTGSLENTIIPVTLTKDGEAFTGAPVNAGTYTASIGMGENENAVVASVEFIIEKANPVIAAAPTPNTLTYIGEAQYLISAGEAVGGAMVYSLTENGEYTTTIPQGTNAGDYTVWYYVQGDANHNDSAKATVDVTIEKAPLTVTASDATITYGEAPTNNGVTYSGFVNGENENVLGGELAYTYTYTQNGNVGDYSITPEGLTADNYEITFVDGTLTVEQIDINDIIDEMKINLEQYSYVYDGTEKKPKVTSITVDGVTLTEGTDYTVRYEDNVYVGNYATAVIIFEGNYDGIFRKWFTITKAYYDLTAPTPNTLTYNGEEQDLVSAGTVEGTDFEYSLDGVSWSTSIPQAKDEGNYTVYYRVLADENHYDVEGTVDVTIKECTHEWGKGVLTRPVYDAVLGSKDGYYTYTCTVCGEEKTETVKSADYSAYEAVSEEINALLQSDELTPEAKQAIYSAANECGLPSNDLTESEQNKVDDLVAELEKIIADAEEKIASGEYVKADYTEIDEAIDDIEEKLASENVTDEGKAGLEEIKKQLEEMKADENTSEADLTELEKALGEYEEELDKGIEDGTLVEVDGIAILIEYNNECAESLIEKYGEENYNNLMNSTTDEVVAEATAIEKEAMALTGTVAENSEKIAELKERLKALFDAAELCLAGTHSFMNYTETSSAKCEVNAKETGTCWFCGETDEREIEGTALEHSFTKYEETEAPKCGVAGKEVAYCDNGCQTTDERETPALEHIFLDYVSNGDATCTADGTKTASCIHGCGETDTVADEGSMIDHSDEDGDKLCDDCGEEVYDRCDICGGKAHGDDKIQLLFCMIITIIRVVTLILKSIN
ncbi:MAG: hypothetical protein E7538_08060 [Ruminococcaceae bacterium]|nr:hypothetical protein [Oscillospiraceae bacterium]